MGILAWSWEQQEEAGDEQSGETRACRTFSPPSGIRLRDESLLRDLPRFFDDEEMEYTDVSVADTGHLPLARRKLRPCLTVMTGVRAGEVITLDRDECIIGRSTQANIRFEDNAVSRAHCRLVRTGRTISVEDLGSTNGVLLNGQRVGSARLSVGDRLQIGETLVLQYGMLDSAEESLAAQLYATSTRDGLTSAFNRRYFEARLKSELAHCRRHALPLSVIVLDLDHFKSVNDTYGHAAGDAILRAVVAELGSMVRSDDIITRLGGEEFAVLIRMASLASATSLAERIRARIEELRVEHEGQHLKATVSIGVSTLSECADSTGEELFALADQRLYRAKREGRNRVC